MKKVKKEVKDHSLKMRKTLKKENDKKMEFLTAKYGMKNAGMENLNDEEMKEYRGAKIFLDEGGMTANELKGP